MDIGRLSMARSQGALANAVQLSLMKIQINTGEEMVSGLKNMMATMAVDASKGNTIDVKA
ncbi:hypothetical protein UT300007_20500 [Clostridium sp. CTA-7]